jgi:F-type H+-transporting ATPase subunit gamma
MASLKDIRKRIQSVEGICKITSAMSMLSSSKLHALQILQEGAVSYVQKFENLASSLARLDFCPKRYLQVPSSTLWIVITSKQGFCGGFVSNIVKESKTHIKNDDEVWCFGERGKQAFGKAYPHLIFYPLEAKIDYDALDALVDSILEKLETFSKICVVHAKMKNIMTYSTTIKTLFPLSPTDSLIECEPKNSSTIDLILKHYVKTSLYAAFVENATCEHAARMISMDMATKNTKKLIENLKLTYNKARQDIITDEIVEIVAGADALQ